ncbi:hypothetical protein [Dokdonia sp.]|uniref:hypothetical protein n=1 Tax=Dokdonia sp. TaxID=2024995 RepID=UPI0032657F50
MKKILSYFMLAIILVACSTDESIDSTIDVANLEVENYKGIFTTVDGQNRGTLDITLSQDGRSATADLILSTGEVVNIFTDQVSDLGNTKEIVFTSSELSFSMTTGEEGETLEASTVTFRGTESSLLVAQNTERAPVNPITGTYICTTCAGPIDNSMTQTFNFMFVTADGNSSITTQTTLGMTAFNGIGDQNSCVAGGPQTTCDITSGDGMTNVGYTAGGGDVTWTGTHTFDNGATGPTDCSVITGSWSWNSPLVGIVDGTFTSDSMCPPTGAILYEDFEDDTTNYTSSIPEFSDGFFDYFTRTDGSNISGGVSIDNIQGNSFFGAQDIDGEGAASAQSITFSGLDVTGLTNLTFSGLFAEDDNGTSQNWDDEDFVIVEYSFNDTDFTPIFAIQSEEPGGDTVNTTPRVDTDFDGIGDGAEITDTLTEYTAMFANDGTTNPTASTTVTIRIRIDFNAGNEDIAIDNVTVSGM